MRIARVFFFVRIPDAPPRRVHSMTNAVAIVAKTPRPPVPPLTLDGVAALRRACALVPLRVALAGAKVSPPTPPPPLPASVVLQVAEIVDTHEHGCGVAVVRLIDGLLCSMLAATDAKARQHDVVTVTAAQSERISCKGCVARKLGRRKRRET